MSGESHSFFFLFKGGIFIRTNIIFNYEDFINFLLEKTKLGSFYLIYDDFYFEEINSETSITREVYILVRNILQPLNVLKYVTFNTRDKFTTKQIFDLVQILRQDTNIIATFFNPKKKECTLLFVSNKDDSMLKHHIKNFLELEVL